jgi:hypothetical protein
MRATGIGLYVLSHEEEALLTLIGVTEGRPRTHDMLVIDIGGGSSEFVVGGPPVVRLEAVRGGEQVPLEALLLVAERLGCRLELAGDRLHLRLVDLGVRLAIELAFVVLDDDGELVAGGGLLLLRDVVAELRVRGEEM